MKPSALLQAGGQTTLLVLNDRTPDGTDVSWIWDVDTEVSRAGGTIVVSGDHDMALRLRYSQMECNNGTLQLIVSRLSPRSPLPCHKHLLVKPYTFCPLTQLC